MIKFIAGLFMGAAFGFIAGAVLSADRKGGLKVEPGEAIVPKAKIDEHLRTRYEVTDIEEGPGGVRIKAKRNDYFNGFDPAPDFDPFCPAVCGNCKHWDSEIFAWGVCKICKRSGIMRQACDVCNIRNGEVIRE